MKRPFHKKSLHAPEFLNEPSAYGKSFSRAISVDFGGATLLCISGTASLDKTGATCHAGDFKAQVKRTYDNLTALLSSARANWHDVIMTRCYLSDMRYYEEFNEYRNWFYAKNKLSPFPASVGIQAALCRPDLLIEIEATAVIRGAPCLPE
jgi:enamine deaminase RidA (YjgF/YER057c/UK114 family)